MFRILGIALLSFRLLVAEELHRFAGKHFLASYLECDIDALCDEEGLVEAMEQAIKASQATLLGKKKHSFSPNGLTTVFLLSESHASLHTYPEHNACFIDLFTCGEACSFEAFDESLQSYLCPKKVSQRVFLRGETIEELIFE